MSTAIFQKLSVLVLGIPLGTGIEDYLEHRFQTAGWAGIAADVNAYLTKQAQLQGGANLVQQMAWNGLGLELTDPQAAEIYQLVSSGAITWAQLLTKAITGLQGTLAQTLDNRGAAAEALTAAIVEQDKEGLYGNPNMNGAAHNVLLAIGADDLTFEQGMEALLALVDNLSAEGVGGVASDGRISGATVYVDANGNGMFDAGEPVGTTGADGSYDVPASETSGTLIMTGGTDILAVAPFNTILMAPAGSSVITALTSLAEALMDIGAAGNVLSAGAMATTALGIAPVNVLVYDPITVLADEEATPEAYLEALAVEKASIQLMNLVAHITAALVAEAGMGTDEAGQAAWEAVAAAAAAGTLDLTDAESLTDIIEDAAGDELSEDMISDLVAVIDFLNDAAEEADTIVELGKVAVVMGDAVEDVVPAIDGSDEDMDAWVIEYTGQDNIDAAEPGFLLPGVPVGDSEPDIPPTGADTTLTVQEDVPHSFSADDFGFSDVNTGDSMGAVRIDSLPGAGTLTFNGVAVTAGQLIDGAMIDQLVYLADPDESGAAYASFDFTVQDESGLFDTESRTLTIDVTEMTEPPTGSVWLFGRPVVGRTIYAFEDLDDPDGMGEIAWSWYVDGVVVDGATDNKLVITEDMVDKPIYAVATYVDGGGATEMVQSDVKVGSEIPNVEPTGTVTITGTAAEDETLTATNDLADEDGMGTVTYQWYADGDQIEGATSDTLLLDQEHVGMVITVRASYVDGGGTIERVFSEPTQEVANVNDAPTLTAVNDFSTEEDTPLVISYEDMLAAADEADEDGDTLSFLIGAVGNSGTLEVSYNGGEDWEAATAGEDALEEGGQLRWTPNENANGEDFAAFSVRAYDGQADSGADIEVNVDVTAVNDAPTLSGSASFSGTEDVTEAFSFSDLAAQFTSGDVEGDAISYIVQTIGEDGTLQLEVGEDVWDTVEVGDEIGAGDNLRWLPDGNVNGTIEAFTVSAYDGDLESVATAPVYVYLSPVNDAPTLTTMATLATATEDTFFTITGEDLADAGNEADVDGDALSFRIEAVSSGTLQIWDDGEDVWEAAGAGTVVTTGDMLQWRGDANANGTLAAFTVVAIDGEPLASSPPVQVYVQVAAVNDAPELTTVEDFAANEDEPLLISYDDFLAAADDFDVDGDTLSFLVGAVGNGGTLEVSYNGGEDWEAATAGEDALEEGGMLRWTPAQDANGDDTYAFSVRAFDGLADSGEDVDVLVDVAPANDAPTLTTVTTIPDGQEDTALEITYETLAAAADEDDIDGDALSFLIKDVSSGTLLKWDGEDSWDPVTEDFTTLAAGEMLQWTPAADESGVLDAFTVTAFDGSLESATPVQVTVDVADDSGRPVLIASASPVLEPVDETVGSGTPAAPANESTDGATQVSALVNETGIANVTDSNSATHGLAITAFDAASQGSLWYSTNDGTSWTELASATAAAALLLDNDDWVIFKPDGGVGGTVNAVFTFKAWDLGSGTSGTTADTTVGDIQFSTTTDTVAITLIAAPGGSANVNGGPYYGGSGNDTINGGGGNDTIFGGGGDDTIDGGGGRNLLDGGSGNDTLTADANNDTATGGTGDDLINLGSGQNSLTGGDGNDTLQSGTGNDTVSGGEGNDSIDAGGGANGIDAGEGDNDVTSGTGNDTITAGDGNDTIDAGGGANEIDAGEGDNNVTSGAGNDDIVTGDGNDTVDAGGGANDIDVGEGDNQVTAGGGNDTVVAGTGNDSLVLGGGANHVTAGSGNDTIVGDGGNDTVLGGQGNDSITVGGGNNEVDGGAGNDTVSALAGNDSVLGGAGNDSVTTEGGADTLVGGGGNDTLDGGSSDDEYYFEDTAAENGTDTLPTFTAGLSQDKLFFSEAAFDLGHGAGTITPLNSSSSGVNISGLVVLYAGATLAAVDGASDIAGIINAASNPDLTLNANASSVVVTGTTGSTTVYVWYVENDATQTVADAEVTLVATITLTAGNLGTFHSDNFGFF